MAGGGQRLREQIIAPAPNLQMRRQWSETAPRRSRNHKMSNESPADDDDDIERRRAAAAAALCPVGSDQRPIRSWLVRNGCWRRLAMG
jgi:hypothetical protein